MICDAQVDGAGPRHFGVYPAIVTDLADPDELGRVEVQLPWLGTDGERDVRAWATLLSPYADEDQGLEILPEVGSQVVVAFEAGDLRRPYVVGAAWNGRERLPERPEAANNKRVLKTRSGSLLEFDDTSGAAKITLSTQSGHELVLDDGAQSVRLAHANGSVITINAAGQIQINANAGVEINAPILTVHAPMAQFDGIVQCSTLVASTGVISPSYTPGAGNVW
jgi:uncharacterized protein involved in type VI secretion and phage assembly